MKFGRALGRRGGIGGALVAVAALASACGGSDDDGPTLTSYFEASPYGQAACDSPDGLLAGHRELRLYRHGDEDLLDVTRGLQRYQRRHGLTFSTSAPPAPIDLAYALDTDEASLGAALVKQFPHVDFNDDAALMADQDTYQQVLKFTINFMFAPVIGFAKTHAAGSDVTNLVLLHQLVRPGGIQIAPDGASLAGLAISPPLLQMFVSSGAPDGNLWRGVDLPAGFSPMMFLDGATLAAAAKASPVLRDLVVAHEFGHTAGLVHRAVPRNLMNPSVSPAVDSCADSLDRDQLDTERTTLGFAPVQQALEREPAAPAEEDRPGRGAVSAFTPRRFRDLLHGDPLALRELLLPVLDVVR